jgi:hypothetical protein
LGPENRVKIFFWRSFLGSRAAIRTTIRKAAFLSASKSSSQFHARHTESGFEEEAKGKKPWSDNIRNLAYKDIVSKKSILHPIDSI